MKPSAPSSKRLKILFCETYNHVAGGQKGLLDLVKYMDKERFEPIVQIQGPGNLKKGLEELDIQIVLQKLEPFKNRWLPFSWQIGVAPFKKVIEKVKPDIVHSNHLYSGRYSGRAAKSLGIPSLVTLRLVQHPEIFDRYNRINTLKIHDKIISNSETGRQFLKDIPSIEQKLITIRNGMDLDKFKPKNNSRELKKKHAEKYGWSENSIIILQVASRVPQKGNEELTRAFLNLCPKNSDIFLMFVGGPFAKADNKNKLEKMAADAGYSEKVIIADFIWDVSEFLNMADISVLASRDREGLPRCLIEAMACGNPLVGTDVGGIKELVLHEKNGFLIQKNNVAELETRLQELINDQPLRKKFGDYGHTLAKENFDIKNMLESYQNVYTELAEGPTQK